MGFVCGTLAAGETLTHDSMSDHDPAGCACPPLSDRGVTITTSMHPHVHVQPRCASTQWSSKSPGAIVAWEAPCSGSTWPTWTGINPT